MIPLVQEVRAMIHPDVRRDAAHTEAAKPSSAAATVPPEMHGRTSARWEARFDLARYRAETERMRVLVEFLSRPVHAHGGSEPDPDIVTAYNLAVEAALQGIRRAAVGG
jgi:hypothetical protein